MATLSLKVNAGEALKLYHWGKVEPYVRFGGTPPLTPVATATADGSGVATFTGQPSRIEFAVQRADGRFVKVMDSTTRNPPR